MQASWDCINEATDTAVCDFMAVTWVDCTHHRQTRSRLSSSKQRKSTACCQRPPRALGALKLDSYFVAHVGLVWLRFIVSNYLMPSADNYEFHSKRFRRKKGEEHYANHRHQPWKRAPVLSWTLMKPKLFKWKILSINQPRNWRWSEWVWRLCNVVRIARKCSAKRLKVAYFQDPCSKGMHVRKTAVRLVGECWQLRRRRFFTRNAQTFESLILEVFSAGAFSINQPARTLPLAGYGKVSWHRKQTFPYWLPQYLR